MGSQEDFSVDFGGSSESRMGVVHPNGNVGASYNSLG
jgi:hypothetical protein